MRISSLRGSVYGMSSFHSNPDVIDSVSESNATTLRRVEFRILRKPLHDGLVQRLNLPFCVCNPDERANNTFRDGSEIVFGLRCHRDSAERRSPSLVEAVEVFFVDQSTVALDEDGVDAQLGPTANGLSQCGQPR